MDSYDRFRAAIEDALSERNFCKPSELVRTLGCTRQRVHQLIHHPEFELEYEYFNRRAIVRKGVQPTKAALATVGLNADRRRGRIDNLKIAVKNLSFPDYTVTLKWVIARMPKSILIYRPELTVALQELTDEGFLLMPHGHNKLGHITTPESWNTRMDGNGPVKSQTDIVRKFLGAYRRTGDTFYPHQVTMSTGVNPGLVYNIINTLMKVGELEKTGVERGLGRSRVLYRFKHPTGVE